MADWGGVPPPRGWLGMAAVTTCETSPASAHPGLGGEGRGLPNRRTLDVS